MDWFMANSGLLFAALFAVSEVLAQIPQVKANSLFQLVYGLLKRGK